MSFSSQAKEELLRIKIKHEGCLTAEFVAAVQACGSLQLSNGQLSLVLYMDSSALCRRIFSCIKELSGLSAQIITIKNNRLSKGTTYQLVLSGKQQVLSLLQQAKLIEGDALSPDLSFSPNTVSWHDCCKRTYLRTLFIACGSVSSPERDYHLELVFKREKLAQEVQTLLADRGFAFKLTHRKSNAVLYLKSAEAIGDFLAYIGAHSAILAHENARIVKQLRNDVNRAVNCETANVQKTVDAAIRQRDAIVYLLDRGKIQTLSAPLQQAAQGRLKHPEASIAELATLMDPPIGKSGMVNRLKKLMLLAEQLGYTG